MMKHNYSLEGYGYRLRPIRLSDAGFIIEARLEDTERNRFLHTISRDISAQEKWLADYNERPGDYYFVVENRITDAPEGLIAFYDEQDGRAEWGRWVLKKGSLAAVESVWLLYRIAFEQVGLSELYCRTVSDNVSVVSFHESIGEKTRQILKGFFELDGKYLDATEQYADRELFSSEIAPKLEKKAQRIFQMNMRMALGEWDFHHIGVATKKIEKELPFYTLMGYTPESDYFEDAIQGIRGIFLVAKNQPRLELLENLPDSHTLDKQLEKGQKYYHMAYRVSDIEKAMEVLGANRARVLSDLQPSTYFGRRICFLMMPNMMMIELVET